MKTQFSLISQSSDKRAESVIYLWVWDSRFKDRKFKYSTKRRVTEGGWDQENEKVKIKGSLSPREKENLHAVNKYLKGLRDTVGEFESQKLNSATLSKEELKKLIESKKTDDRQHEEAELRKESDFFKIWQSIIDTTRVEGKLISSGTKGSKEQTLTKLTAFSVDEKFKPTFENLDKDFYSRFTAYLENEGLSPNTIGKHIKELKAVLREADDRGYKVNPSYLKKSFKVIREKVDNIYLNEEQLRELLEGKFEEELSPAETRQRDIFVAASLVGARHSDWHQIRQSNIEKTEDGEMIKIKQQKTKRTIHIPLHPIVKRILKKYDGELPKIISNQKFNSELKDIGKKAKLKNWNQLTTHTARRSFCTNCYLAGMDVHQIMEFSGHKSESSFLKYLKLEGRDFAIKASKNKFFSGETWEPKLKIA